MRSARCALVVIAALIMGCVHHAERASAFNSVQSAYTNDRPDSRVTLVFFQNHYLYASGTEDYQNSRSDSGDRLTKIVGEDVSYIEGLPIFAPAPGVDKWRRNGFDCVAKRNGESVLISCATERRVYRSIYNEKLGVSQFEYLCDPYSKDICNYKLVTDRGLLTKNVEH